MKLYFIKEKTTGKFLQSERYCHLADIEAAFQNGCFKKDKKSAEKTIKELLKDGTDKYNRSYGPIYRILSTVSDIDNGYQFSSVKSVAEKYGVKFMPVEWEIVEYSLTLG